MKSEFCHVGQQSLPNIILLTTIQFYIKIKACKLVNCNTNSEINCACRNNIIIYLQSSGYVTNTPNSINLNYMWYSSLHRVAPYFGSNFGFVELWSNSSRIVTEMFQRFLIDLNKTKKNLLSLYIFSFKTKYVDVFFGNELLCKVM